MTFPVVFGRLERAGSKKKLPAFFVLFFILYFAPLSFAGVIVPSELGAARDRAQGTNGKTVVLIEEAHVQYAAQKALANILQDLIEHESFRYVFVEGGWGDVSLSNLRTLTNLPKRQEVAEEYLRQGQIAGEEYLTLATDLDIRVWGVEDPKLYEANMKFFLPLSEVQPALLEALEKLNAQLQALRARALTPEMNAILDNRQAFDARENSLLDHALFLMKRLPDTSARYFWIAQLAAFSGKDGSYDPDKIGLEKKAALRFLSKNLTKPELEEILSLDGQKTMETELVFLDALLKKTASFEMARKELSLQNLRNYRDILRKTAGMDVPALSAELEKAELEALALQKPLPDQQLLLDLFRKIRFLRKFFSLQLTVNEFLALQQYSPFFKRGETGDSKKIPHGPPLAKEESSSLNEEIETWNGILETMCKKNGLPYSPYDAALFLKHIPGARAFYETAVAREDAMIKNAVAKIEEIGADRAAFVMGGFHSRNVFNALKERGYTVLLVSPRFEPEDEKTAHEQYLNILKYKWTGKPEASGPEFKSQNSKLGNLDPKTSLK